MKKTDKILFLCELNRLAMLYNTDMPLDVQQTYWLALEHYPLERVLDAFVDISQNQKFMPKPVEVKSAIHSQPQQSAQIPERTTFTREELADRALAAQYGIYCMKNNKVWSSVDDPDYQEFKRRRREMGESPQQAVDSVISMVANSTKIPGIENKHRRQK